MFPFLPLLGTHVYKSLKEALMHLNPFYLARCLDPDPKLLLKLPPNFSGHFLRRRVISVLKLVAVGGAAHNDAVNGRVEAELHGQVFDVHVLLLAPLPHRVSTRLSGPVRLNASQAPHAEDAGQNQARTVFFGQAHGGASDGLVEECVVEEREDDLGVAGLNGSAVEVVSREPPNQCAAPSPLPSFSATRRKRDRGPNGSGDIGRVVD